MLHGGKDKCQISLMSDFLMPDLGEIFLNKSDIKHPSDIFKIKPVRGQNFLKLHNYLIFAITKIVIPSCADFNEKNFH